MLIVVDKNNIDVNNNGVAIINDAIDVHINKKINDINSLEFKIPFTSKNYKYLDPGKYYFNINKELYLLLTVTDDDNTKLSTISCRHIITELGIDNFISIYPVMAGKTPTEIIQKALDIAGDTKFHLFSDAELTARGMTWVSDKMDLVDGLDNVKVYDIISKVIESEKRGELYCENFYFAIVEKIGNEDSNYSWSPSKNISSLSRKIDYSQIINKVIIEGKDGLPLDDTVYPGSFLLSQSSIDKYGLKVGHIAFNDVDNQTELLNKALWEINENNIDRIDEPKLTINVTASQIKNQNPRIGDSIRIICNTLNLNTIKRIVGIDYYPYAPNKTTYTIGDKVLTLAELLAKLNLTRETVNNNTTTNNSWSISGLEQIVPYISNKNYCKNSSFELYDDLDHPLYWDSDAFVCVGSESRFGDKSLKILTKSSVVQTVDAAIDWTQYQTESKSTILEFYYKGGAISVCVLDDNNNKIAHQSKMSETYEVDTAFPASNAWGEAVFIIVKHEQIPANSKIRLKITSTDADNPTYLDGVQIGAQRANRLTFYTDGPESMGDGTGGKLGENSSQFTFSENKDDILITPNSEMTVAQTEISTNPLSDMAYFLKSTTSETTNIKPMTWSLYVDNAIHKSYPVIAFPNRNCITEGEVSTKLKDGAHIVQFKIKNEGSENITVEKYGTKLSVFGKSLKVKEVAPYPIITISEIYKYFNISDWIQSQLSLFKLSGTHETHNFTITTPVYQAVIKQAPSKIDYKNGDVISVDGMVILLKTNGVEYRYITDYTYNPKIADKTNPVITITFTDTKNGNNNTYTLTQNINVYDMYIKTPPAKIIYNVGETIDLTGIVVESTKNNVDYEEVPLRYWDSSFTPATATAGLTQIMINKTYYNENYVLTQPITVN